MTHGHNYQRAEFAGSFARAQQLPPDQGIEVAFAGRSNAGKSSALNALTGRRGLARTSRTPGRTQLINLFALGGDVRLVDLPGYGYAQVPEAVRRGWTRLLGDYLARRQALRGLVLVVDARRGLTRLDWTLLEQLGERPLALHVLLTKSDKLGRGPARQALERARQELEDAGIEASLQCFSATRGEGVEDLQGLLDEWLADAA
ncbi:MAG: ribosome biogenesis GTP-binding protein YihA/YsxC [Halofilum sp. (in: g-proteobacteria)]|nr:ribosome biogenesis GTP-binding protein YihA/YsxC [Halofilum sp. (in: g-proteobacteria)]